MSSENPYKPVASAKLPSITPKVRISNVSPATGVKSLINWMVSLPSKSARLSTCTWSYSVPAVVPPISITNSPPESCVKFVKLCVPGELPGATTPLFTTSASKEPVPFKTSPSPTVTTPRSFSSFLSFFELVPTAVNTPISTAIPPCSTMSKTPESSASAVDSCSGKSGNAASPTGATSSSLELFSSAASDASSTKSNSSSRASSSSIEITSNSENASKSANPTSPSNDSNASSFSKTSMALGASFSELNS